MCNVPLPQGDLEDEALEWNELKCTRELHFSGWYSLHTYTLFYLCPLSSIPYFLTMNSNTGNYLIIHVYVRKIFICLSGNQTPSIFSRIEMFSTVPGILDFFQTSRSMNVTLLLWKGFLFLKFAKHSDLLYGFELARPLAILYPKDFAGLNLWIIQVLAPYCPL